MTAKQRKAKSVAMKKYWARKKAKTLVMPKLLQPVAEQIVGLQHPDASFTAEQVMALLRELWRKGP